MERDETILRRSRPRVSVVDFTRDEVIDWLRKRLRGRVCEAFLFGSVAAGAANPWSDLDVLLITETDLPFVERPGLFLDLFDIGTGIDMVVYTPDELAAMRRAPSSFLREVERTKVQIL